MGSPPHTRGTLVDTEGNIQRWGSPPHTRGTRIVKNFKLRCIRITPAYAGNTSYSPLKPAGCKDHPRIRGEHPHSCCPSAPGKDHPRIRGEHPMPQKRLSLFLGSPPHTRGTRLRKKEKSLQVRITPAYAGNTSKEGRKIWEVQDHPRIRGEHLSCRLFYSLVEGSPPHTRGTRSLGRQANRFDGDHPRIRGEH